MHFAPKEVDGLADLETNFSSRDVTAWTFSVTQESEADAYFPRIKRTSQFDLTHALDSLGMTTAFATYTADYTADSSGMTDDRNSILPSVKHQSFAGINDSGTKRLS